MTLQCLDVLRQHRDQALATDTVGPAPHLFQRRPHSTVVLAAPRPTLDQPVLRRMVQQMNRILAVVARGCDELIQDVLLARPIAQGVARSHRLEQLALAGLTHHASHSPRPLAFAATSRR